MTFLVFAALAILGGAALTAILLALMTADDE